MKKWWVDYGKDKSWEPGQKYTHCPDGCCLIKVTAGQMHCERTGQVFKLGDFGTIEIDWYDLFLYHNINTTGKKGKALVRLVDSRITGFTGQALENYLKETLQDWD
jgi:hypothetical protein